jgi:hypothetical protein
MPEIRDAISTVRDLLIHESGNMHGFRTRWKGCGDDDFT